MASSNNKNRTATIASCHRRHHDQDYHREEDEESFAHAKISTNDFRLEALLNILRVSALEESNSQKKMALIKAASSPSPSSSKNDSLFSLLQGYHPLSNNDLLGVTTTTATTTALPFLSRAFDPPPTVTSSTSVSSCDGHDACCCSVASSAVDEEEPGQDDDYHHSAGSVLEFSFESMLRTLSAVLDENKGESKSSGSDETSSTPPPRQTTCSTSGDQGSNQNSTTAGTGSGVHRTTRKQRQDSIPPLVQEQPRDCGHSSSSDASEPDHYQNDRTDLNEKSREELQKEIQSLQQTVQECYKALLSVQKSADLKTRQLELKVLFLERQVADEQALSNSLLTTNQALKHELNASFKNAKDENDKDKMKRMAALRQKEMAMEKNINALQQERNVALQQNTVLKRMLLQTCTDCRARLPIKRVKKSNKDNEQTATTGAATMTRRDSLTSTSSHALEGFETPPQTPRSVYGGHSLERTPSSVSSTSFPLFPNLERANSNGNKITPNTTPARPSFVAATPEQSLPKARNVMMPKAIPSLSSSSTKSPRVRKNERPLLKPPPPPPPHLSTPKQSKGTLQQQQQGTPTIQSPPSTSKQSMSLIRFPSVGKSSKSESDPESSALSL